MKNRSFFIFLMIISGVLIAWYGYLDWQLVFRAHLTAFQTWVASGLLALPFMMMLGFILDRVLTRHDKTSSSALSFLVHWASFLSMGFLNFILVLAVIRQLLCFFIPISWGLDGALGTGLVLGGGLLLLMGGIAIARFCIQIVQVEIPLEGKSSVWDGFRIVQISDLHIDWAVSSKNIEQVIQKANEQHPDMIVLTGDMADGKVADLHKKFRLLSKLSAPKGVFYITGNHEYYWGAEAWIEEVRRIGIVPLLNEHRLIEHRGQHLVLAGITDYQGNMTQSVYGAPEGVPRILLAHQPLHAMGAVSLGFDLQLSGHTHGGQFFPWTFFIRWAQKFHKGLFKLESMWVYVNRGTGFWGPPIRLGSSPEITVITLIS